MSATTSSSLVSLLFVGLMGAAIWSDARDRRLPNRLMLATLLAGLALRVGMGPGGVLSGVEAVLLGVALGVPLFVLGAIGGGDVKLLAAAGAFLGPQGLPWALLLGAGLSLLLAVEEIARRRVALPVLMSTRQLAIHLVTLGRRGERPLPDAPGSVRVPYGVAIGAGAVMAWFVPMARVLP